MIYKVISSSRKTRLEDEGINNEMHVKILDSPVLFAVQQEIFEVKDARYLTHSFRVVGALDEKTRSVCRWIIVEAKAPCM